MKKDFCLFVVVLFPLLLLTSCGTLISQQIPVQDCNKFDGPLPNIYSGVILDARVAFHYKCVMNQCKYFNYEGNDNVGLFFLLDMPLSLALDTALLPFTAYRQIRYGDICKIQPKSASAGIHLVSIDVTPTTPSIAKGSVQQFAATGIYSDGNTINIGAYVTWSSSDASKVTIDGSGLASALEAGSVQITATSGNIIGTSTLTVAK